MCQNVLCVVNVQHDCASAGCAQTTNEAIRQEREVSASTRKIIQHTKTNMYILNTYSIHNYKDIRDAIPQELPPREPSVHGATVRAAAVASMARKKEDAARAKTTAPSIIPGGTPAPRLPTSQAPSVGSQARSDDMAR